MKNLTLALSIVVAAAGPLAAAELKIGTSADYAPWESVDAAGQIVGFDRDVGDEMCKRIQATCTWENQAFDGLLPGLQVGKFDLVISGVSINEERSKKVEFSVAYSDAPHSIAIAAGGTGKDATSAAELVEALKGKAIGVQTGSTHEQVIKAHFPDATVRIYDRPEQVADDIKAGRIDAGLMERSAWEPLMAASGGKIVFAGPLLTSSDFVEFGHGQGIVLRKGQDELKAKVDAAVVDLLKDGTLKTLSQKWFGYDVSARP